MRPFRSLALLLSVVAAAAPAETLIVGNKGEDTVSLIDLATGRQRGRLPTGPQPHEVAISPDGRRAAVVAYGGASIDLFDVAAAKKLETIALGPNRSPHGLVWLADNRLIATTQGSDTLTVVLANARGAPDRVYAIPTGQKGSHMVAVHQGSTAYVTNMESATVSVIDLDGQRPRRDVRVGRQPEGLALSRDGARLWVADRGGAEVHVFDTATMKRVGTVPTGATPIRVAISPDGRTAITSSFAEGTLTAIDTATLKPVRTIRVGDKASDLVTILFSADGRRLYAAETGPDRVAEVDVAAGRVLRRIPVGRDGDGLAIAP